MSKQPHTWKRPRSRAEMVRIVKRLRDASLHKYVYGLDRAYPYTIAFDEDGSDSIEEIRPLKIAWHDLPESQIVWSDQYGCIGPACVWYIRTDVDPINYEPFAMYQVGGVKITEQELPLVKDRYETVKTRRGVLVFLESQHFLSANAIRAFARGVNDGDAVINPDEHIKDTRSFWHKVPEWIWQTVVARTARKLAPSADTIARIRARELDKLKASMDPNRLTPEAD